MCVLEGIKVYMGHFGVTQIHRHALKLRTAKDAHPQIRALMQPLLCELRGMIPLLFDDITES